MGSYPEEVTVSENDVDALLTSLAVPKAHRGDVAEFYARHLWDDEGVIAACAPYRACSA